jgi:hypothetical protein
MFKFSDIVVTLLWFATEAQKWNEMGWRTRFASSTDSAPKQESFPDLRIST